MFALLEQINQRPRPFECYTASDLWTDAHTSSRMLAWHLDEKGDIASRNARFIDRSADWIVSRFNVGVGTKVADFGCGPGLYATRISRRGASVTGIDFSRRSIEYARQSAAREKLDIRYVNQDYLEFETTDRFDVVLLIMCDYCALSPAQRRRMLGRFRRNLKPNGAVLLDVYSLAAYHRREEAASYAVNLLDGFWSPDKYFGFLNVFKYDREKLVLDKYTIVEPGRTRTVFNWLQYFGPDDITREFAGAGFGVEAFYNDVAGAPFEPGADEFAVIARPV